MDATVLSDTAPLDLRLSPDELDATRDHIVEFVRSVVDDAGADGAVLGLSGGIDSTTVAHLAVEALGRENVHGVVMPSEVNTDQNMSDAERVAQELGIEYDVVESAAPPRSGFVRRRRARLPYPAARPRLTSSADRFFRTAT